MKALTDKRLFFTSIILAIYFLFLFLNAYQLGIQSVLFGIVQEAFTLPLLVVLVFFTGLAVQRVVKKGVFVNPYLPIAFLTLLGTVALTAGSLLLAIF
ncbi:hypothetical protein [Spirosoma gilvum]